MIRKTVTPRSKGYTYIRSIACTLLIVVSGVALAEEAPADLRLDGPSVVALYTPDEEVTEQERNSEGFYDFLDDYRHYASTLQASLGKIKGVKYFASYARRVSFKQAGVAPITRKALSGYGFVVYVPGKMPRLFRGVVTDIDVLCTLNELDASITVGVQCEPNDSLQSRQPELKR